MCMCDFHPKREGERERVCEDVGERGRERKKGCEDVKM